MVTESSMFYHVHVPDNFKIIEEIILDYKLINCMYLASLKKDNLIIQHIMHI